MSRSCPNQGDAGGDFFGGSSFGGGGGDGGRGSGRRGGKCYKVSKELDSFFSLRGGSVR